MRDCGASATGAAASGIITNTGTKAVAFRIAVAFTSDTGSNLGEASTKVTAAASKDTAWSVKATFASPPKNVRCVLIGVE